MDASSRVKKLTALCKKLTSNKDSVGATSLEANQTNFVAVVDDNLLVWSCQDCCFYAQHLLHEDAALQTLSITRPPLWPVQRIEVNKGGTGVLLVGRRGVGVVDLPQRWGKQQTFDGGSTNITCRIEYLAERFLVSQQRVCVAAAKWHPGSVHQNKVLLLATDHYFRVYSLRARDVPEQALSINVPRPGNIFSRQQPLGASALGEEPVDFTVGAALVSSLNKERVVDAGDDGSDVCHTMQWPVFVLYANGDVYHCNLSTHSNRLRSRVVRGPLLLLPARTDNYGLDWCSVTWLGTPDSGLLVLATNSGKLHHCIAMPAPPPGTIEAADVKTEIEIKSENPDQLPGLVSTLSVSHPEVVLWVYECVDLELCPTAGEEVCPVMLLSDSSMHNRYLAIHSTGVHSITAGVVDSLSSLSADAQLLNDVESECSVEHLISSRPMPSSSALSVLGVATYTALVPHSRTQLMVLLTSGEIVGVRLPPSLPVLPVPSLLSSAADGDKSMAISASSGECFESVIRRCLSRGVGQPVLVGGEADPDPLEALDLTNSTLHTLRTQYIAPQEKALHLTLHRVRVLSELQRSLCVQLSEVQEQREQLQESALQLQQQTEDAKLKQADISDRLDAVVSASLRRLPGLSGGERWLVQQLQQLQDRMPHLHTSLQHVRTKLHWHAHNTNTGSAAVTDLALSQHQIDSLKKNIGSETEKIEKLVGRYNSLKMNLEN